MVTSLMHPAQLRRAALLLSSSIHPPAPDQSKGSHRWVEKI